MRNMCIYLYIGSYGDGIVLIDMTTVKTNILRLYIHSNDWEYVGCQKFPEKILRKLDTNKTLDEYGEIDLSYFE